MRAAPSVVTFRLIIGLGLAATWGCSGPAGSNAALDPAAASAAHGCHGKGEEASCCARHFPGNRRLRDACLADAEHHRGVCAPAPCPPPRDAGGTPDAGRDGGLSVDAGSRDAAGVDASTGSDASPTDGGGVRDASASDGSGPPTCPANTFPVETPEQIGVYSGWKWTVALGAGQTATWTAVPSMNCFGAPFTLLETSGPIAEVECRGTGDVYVNLTISGPGACTSTIPFLFGECTATCGNGIVEKGEQCDPPDGVLCNDQCQAPFCADRTLEAGEDCERLSSTFCQDCRYNSCYACVVGHANTELCSTTTGAQKIACQGLAECLFAAGCTINDLPYRCFCTTADCSAGATGACGPALEQYLGTTDPAQVSAAINSADVTQLLSELTNAYPCHEFCSAAMARCP